MGHAATLISGGSIGLCRFHLKEQSKEKKYVGRIKRVHLKMGLGIRISLGLFEIHNDVIGSGHRTEDLIIEVIASFGVLVPITG